MSVEIILTNSTKGIFLCRRTIWLLPIALCYRSPSAQWGHMVPAACLCLCRLIVSYVSWLRRRLKVWSASPLFVIKNEHYLLVYRKAYLLCTLREIIQNDLGPIKIFAITVLFCTVIITVLVFSKYLCTEVVCKSQVTLLNHDICRGMPPGRRRS